MVRPCSEFTDQAALFLPRDRSPLLDLPEAVLREVISWSPDGATANALLNTCRTAHQQRSNPATAALLLVRCPCRDYHAALASCTACLSGPAAVVQQLLQLMGAGPESGGPFSVPAPLLQAALCSAAAAEDGGTIRLLVASPQPPDLDADQGQAARISVCGAPPHHALQALLECGADPCRDDCRLFRTAAKQRGTPHALLLLLRHCPPGRRPAAIVHGTMYAIASGNAVALGCLLRHDSAARADWSESMQALVIMAACKGLPDIMQLVLSLTAPTAQDREIALVVSAGLGDVACATLLLDGGAGNIQGALHITISAAALRASSDAAGTPVAEEAVRGMAHLLLTRGAAAAPAVFAVAEMAGLRGMLESVVQEVAAAGNDP